MEQKEKTWLTEFSRDYGARELHRSDLKPDPIAQFREWFEEGKSTLQEPTAMALATADAQGRPSQRMVLMKGFDHEGILFGTSYESRKSRELKENPHASLLFYWPALERQVRITGPISRASVTESDEIFMARRRGSRYRRLQPLLGKRGSWPGCEITRPLCELHKPYKKLTVA